MTRNARCINRWCRFFKDSGLINEVFPSKTTYDVIAIFGGIPTDTRERMYHVVKLWGRGVRANQIIYINGKRKLFPIEQANHGLNTINTDTPSQLDWIPPNFIQLFQGEMAVLIWEQLVNKESKLYSKFEVMTISPVGNNFFSIN